MSNYKISSLFASVLSLATIFIFSIYCIGFHIDSVSIVKIAGITLFINFFSSIFIKENSSQRTWWNNDAILTLYGLFILAVVGYFVRYLVFLQWLVWVFVILGFYLSIMQIKVVSKTHSWKKLTIPLIIVWMLGIFFINENYAKFGYFSSFQEIISLGTAKFGKGVFWDVIYHSVLSKMYQTYQIPTTGVDGVVWMHYNTASHWLIANLSLLLDTPTWLFYNVGYQAIFFGLFFRLLTSLVIDVQQYFFNQKNQTPSFGIDSWQFWILVVIIFVPIPTNLYMQGLLGYHFTISSPYTIALGMLWAVLSSILSFIQSQTSKKLFLFLFLPAMLFIVGFNHVATIVILTACIGYAFLRLGLYKDILNWLTIFLTVSVLGVCYFLTAESTFTGRQHSYEGALGWFFFFKQHNTEYVNLIFVFYGLLYIATILYIKNEKLTIKQIFVEKKAFLIEVLWIAALAGLAPNIVLQLYGSTGMYFLGLYKWIAGVFLLAYIPFVKINFFEKKWFFYTKLLVSGLVLVLFIGRFFKSSDMSIKKGMTLRSQILEKEPLIWKTRHFVTKLFCCDDEWKTVKELYSSRVQEKIEQNEFYQIIKSWEKLDDLPISIKKQSLLFIPYKDFSIYKDITHFEQGEILMVAPYVTGVATIRGLPSPELSIGAYGYSYFDQSSREKTWKEGYSVEELKQIAKAQKAKYLWVYSFKTKDFEKITL